MNNICRICGLPIMQMCRKNTGICGEICEKQEKQIQSMNREAYTAEQIRMMEGFTIQDSESSMDRVASVYG